MVKLKYNDDDFSYLKGVYYHIMEFLLFQKSKLVNYLINFDNNNINIRKKFINKSISEEEFKNILFYQKKRKTYIKIIINLLLSIYDKSVNIFMGIYKNNDNLNQIELLINDSNNQIKKISNHFNYSKYPIIYHWFNLKLNIKL